jgi:hypothetical protein
MKIYIPKGSLKSKFDAIGRLIEPLSALLDVN